MLFAIDVGNTHTLLGIYDGEELTAHWRISTDHHHTVDELGILSRTLLQLQGIEAGRVSGVVIANVVPPLTSVLRRLAQRYFDIEPLMVTADLINDMKVHYRPPTDVGPDRLVNAVAARTLYGSPAVIVDFGTATTFDVVAADGSYLGGVIATGVGVSADALFARAARLPRVDLVRPASVIGTTTVQSVQAGLFYGYVDLVDGLLERISAEMDSSSKVVATGGWAETFGPACRRIEVVDPLLTLSGLRLIAARYGG